MEVPSTKRWTVLLQPARNGQASVDDWRAETELAMSAAPTVAAIPAKRHAAPTSIYEVDELLGHRLPAGRA